MKKTVFATVVVASSMLASGALASELIYKPTNPSLGGDPLNGNWLLSQASAQTADGGSPSFSIDFPDFGGITQPAPTTVQLPDVPGTSTTNGG